MVRKRENARTALPRTFQWKRANINRESKEAHIMSESASNPLVTTGAVTAPNPNSAKGGKNLAMMQQLFEKQQQSSQDLPKSDETTTDMEVDEYAAVPNARPGKSADHLLTLHQKKIDEAISNETNSEAPSLIKTKGKNFDQMVKANPYQLPSSSSSSTNTAEHETQPLTASAATTLLLNNKVRGKDFQTMMQRAPEDIVPSMSLQHHLPINIPNTLNAGHIPSMPYNALPHFPIVTASTPILPKPKKSRTSKPTKSDATLFLNSPISDKNSLGPKLSTILSSIDPTGTYVLQEETEEQILHLVDDFLNSVVEQSVKLAKHRSGDNPAVVDVTDVALALKKGWGMTVPLFSPSLEVGATPALGSGAASRAFTPGRTQLTLQPTFESVQKKAKELAAQTGMVKVSPMMTQPTGPIFAGMKRPAAGP